MNNLRGKYINQDGQALLLVLLSMAVILTISLSILSRSVTDVAVTSNEEGALRAFSAAEAGVEKALLIGSSIGETQLGDARYTADVTNYGEGQQSFNYPVSILSGESIVAWFVAHDTDGNLVCNATTPCFTGNTMKVCWGTGAGDPAVEVSVFYAETPGDYSTMKVARMAIDPNTSRQATNSFSAPDAGSCTIDSKNYSYQKTINLDTDLGIPSASYSIQNGLQFARVRMLYNTTTSQPIGFDFNFAGNSTVPSQGIDIASTGQAADSNRKVNVFQSYGQAPPIFDGSIFSLGGLTK